MSDCQRDSFFMFRHRYGLLVNNFSGDVVYFLVSRGRRCICIIVSAAIVTAAIVVIVSQKTPENGVGFVFRRRWN